MYRSTFALAVTATVLAQQASAAGFIEDSKATLGLRNFYINSDNRDSAARTASGVQSKNEEWGQALIFALFQGTHKALWASVSTQ